MKIVKASSSSKRKVRTCTFSPQVNIKNKRTAVQTEQDVNAAHSEAKLQDLINDIKSNIYTKVKAVATSPDFGFDENEVDDYFFVEASATEIGEDHHEAIRVEVRGEVSYEGLEDLMEALNPIIESYDSYAYFEPVEPGIIEAYVSVNQIDMSIYGATASPDHMFYDYHGKRFSVHDNSSEIGEDSIDDVYFLWKGNISQEAGAYNDADEDYVYAFIRGRGVIEYYKKGKYVATDNYTLRDEDDFEYAWEYMEIILQHICDRLIAYNKDVPDRMVHNSTDVLAASLQDPIDLDNLPDDFVQAYLAAKEDFESAHEDAFAEVSLINDSESNNDEVCAIVEGTDVKGKPVSGKVYLYKYTDNYDVIFQALDETADAIGLNDDLKDAVESAYDFKTSENYKGRRIKLLNDGTGYAIFEKGEMIDYGFKSLEDAEAAVDEYDEVYQDDIQVYSATNDGEGYWFFTTHGVQPGSVPRDVDILDIIDTPNGSFVKFNRFLSTKELNEYDMKERAPKSVMSAEAEELRAEDNPWIQEIDWAMSQLPSWFKVQGDNLEYNVTFNGHTVYVEFFLFDGAKYTYYIDGHGPYTTNQSERIGSDIEDYINRNFEGVTSANDIEDADSDEDLPMVDQEYDSAATSINSSKLPAIYKMINLEPGGLYVDFGGGRWDNAVEYIKDKGSTLVVYDPYNRSADHNKEVLRILRENGGADAAVNSNVLNVIKEPEARKNVLENIARITKPGAPIYITVYEGKGNGQEGPTKSGYQLNRKTADYLEEIQEVFPDATRRGKLITAHNSGSIASSEDITAEYNIQFKHSVINELRPLLVEKLESKYGIEFFVTDMFIEGDNMHIQVYGDDKYHGDIDIPVDYSFDIWDLLEDAFNKFQELFDSKSSSPVKSYTDVEEDISRYDKDVDRYHMMVVKSVEDSDGFLTEYAMYEVRLSDGSIEYECYLGDRDLYGPWNGEGLDFSSEDYDEAVEWWNSYDGFEDENLKDVYSSDSIGNHMTITVNSGISGDGFSITVEDEQGDVVFNEEYRFGVNTSYDRKYAEIAEEDYQNAKKYGWSRIPELKPYAGDIIDDICNEYNIQKKDIVFKRGNNVFKRSEVTDSVVNDFIDSYINSSYSINGSFSEDEAAQWGNDYNGFEVDDITSSTILDANPEFRNNFEEAIDFFYESYPATVELTDEVDEDYDTLYKAYVKETGSLYQQTPGIVYIDINWDSGEILQALQETAEAIGIEQYPDNIESSESVEGDAFSQLEDAYLSPSEYDDPIEHEDSQELIEVELDQVITVDVDGDYEWDDDTYVWASPDGSNEEWRSEDGIYIDDKVGVVEHIDDLIIPNVPTRPGKYRVTGLAKLIYDVSGIQEYRTDYGPDDYESDLDTDHAVVSFNFSKSSVETLKITPVRR